MIPFVTSGISSLQRVYEIINEETDVVTDPNVKPVNIGKFKGGVHFKNVSLLIQLVMKISPLWP